MTTSHQSEQTNNASPVDALVREQREFFRTGQTKTFEFRTQQLARFAQVVDDNQEAIYQALHADLKKPRLEAFTGEIAVVLEELSYARKHLRRWMRPRKVPTPLYLQPARSFIQHEPLGVALIIGPWNYPLQLTLTPLIGAIAAGNCAIVKPSELTPHTSALIAKIMATAFPANYVAVVEGGVTETTALLDLKFDSIFFTGSTPVGKIIAQAAARHLIPVTLELGGKSPVVVCEDADLELAARRILWGKFVNAGQTCVAPDYLYVHESIAADLLARMQTVLRGFFDPNPQASASYGRIVNARHFDRVLSYLANARIVTGGSSDRDELYISPTIVTDVTWQDPMMQGEIFGPILPVLRYSKLEDAIAEINRHDKPLSAYIFTSSHEHEQRFLNEISFGGGCVNDTVVHLSTPHLPFGGVGASGSGAYHGEKSFLTFSHAKSIVRKATYLDWALRYPPYTEGKFRWARRLMIQRFR